MPFNKEPHCDLKICVIVPVKNESETIIECLDSLKDQKLDSSTNLNKDLFEVLLLANNCDDNTFDIVETYRKKFSEFHLFAECIEFEKEKAHIGTARRYLMDIAFDRLQLVCPNGIIASTDGDSRVDKYWIANMLNEFQKGCDVLGGAIKTQIEDCPAKPYHIFDIQYQNLIAKLENLIDFQSHNPWPSHFQCFGANLAVTTEMYEKAGRLPVIPSLEDVAFIEALELIDAKVRKSPSVIVFTSTRKQGRVERGLSQQISYFDELGTNHQKLIVESCAAIKSRFMLKNNLRNAWLDYKKNGQSSRISCRPFKEEDLIHWLEKSFTFGLFWKNAKHFLETNNWFHQWEEVEIQLAIEQLSAEIESIETNPSFKSNVA